MLNLNNKIRIYILSIVILSIPTLAQAQVTGKITEPPSNTRLSANTITFKWSSGQNVTEYYLGVGTSFSSVSKSPWGNIFTGTVTGTSKTINNLPLKGTPIFVRLWSRINGLWEFEDYSYPTEGIPSQPAEIISPAPENILKQTEETFTWTTGSGVSEYYIGVGSSLSSVSNKPWGNVFAEAVTGTSVKVSGIPLTGAPLFVRLWSKIDGAWQIKDYTYSTEKQGGSNESQSAEITAPPVNTLIKDPTIVFEWTQGKNVTAYYLGVGTSFNSVAQTPWGNIFADNVSGTSRSVSNIPLNGQKLFVRLWSKINGAWQMKDYSYDTDNQIPVNEPAQITSPVPESILNQSNVNFQWTVGGNVKEYYLGVGTSFNSVSNKPWGNIFAGTVTSTSHTVSGILLNGKPVFVRLWSKIDGNWFTEDYTYQTENQGKSETPAEITSPQPGSLISQANVNFQWTQGIQVSSYYLGVGKSFNSINKAPWGDVFAGTITGTSKEVSNIPLSGQDIFVRLWSKINGTWEIKDYTFKTTLNDSVPPGPPANLTVSNVTSTSLQVNWKAATDNFAVAGYRIDAAIDQEFTQFVSGYQNKDSGNTLNHVVTNLTGNTKYFIRLRAYDHAGNLSINSPVISATTLSSGGPTIVDGNITADTTWTADGSPYIIKSNTTVNSVSVLTIQPGTVIRFDGNFFLSSAGKIIAEGTAAQPIVFTSNKSSPTAGSWQYLYLNGGSSVKHARIEYSDQGILADKASMIIENVISERNRIGFNIQGGSPVLSNITSKNNTEGIRLGGATLAQITQSVIQNNADGIVLSLEERNADKNNTPVINQNKIFGNTNFHIKTTAASSPTFTHENKIINAKNNWWGTTDISEIEQKILDNKDARLAPQVIYDPILFDENGEAVLKNISISKVFLNPQKQENSLIRYTLSMSSEVTVKLYNYENNTLVRTLINKASRAAGANQESFNGKNDEGTDLLPGVYYFIIEALTNTNQRGLYAPIHVPSPVNTINALFGPAQFNPYNGERAKLEYGLQVPSWVTARIGRSGQANADRLLVDNQPRPETGNVEFWDGRDNQGAIVMDTVYKAVIFATCLPTNALAITQNTTELIEYVKASPYAMYPLYGESTEITYKLLQPAKITVQILDPQGKIIRTLLNNEQFSNGINSVQFDGKTSNKAVISKEGEYKILVTADMNGQKQTKEGYLKIFP